MKSQSLILTLLCGIILIGGARSTRAATFTWSGNTGGLWSTGTNWVGGSAPGATSQMLVFTGTSQTTINNSLTTTSTITFLQGAGAFILQGNAFALNNNIINLSSNLQTIENALTITSPRSVITGSGGVLISGAISGAAGALSKGGAGTLYLTGANTYDSITTLNLGRIVLDASKGGSLASPSLQFGSAATISTMSPTIQGGAFEVVGKTSGTTTVAFSALGLNNATGANQIVLKSNGGASTELIISGTLSRGSGAGNPTLNVDLSSGNGHVRVATFANNASTNAVNGLLAYATVTETVSGSKVTGLAGIVANPTYGFDVVRVVPTLSLPNSVSGPSNEVLNYKTEGSVNITANSVANSVTITGTGAMTGLRLETYALMMQEGVGNYTISNSTIGKSNNGFFIHQYSTSGTLSIAANIYNPAPTETYRTNNNLAKAGPGAVVFSGHANPLIGATDIQGGLFQLDGSLAGTSVVSVRDGATLRGHGIIGGGFTANNGSTVRYTPVNIFGGGTLVSDNKTANALSIHGSLALHAESTFKMDLYANAKNTLNVIKDPTGTGTVVSLDGNLSLTLNYGDLDVNDVIWLLTSNGQLAGQFATINNQAFLSGSTFHLSYNSAQYTFGITYDYLNNDVYLTTLAVPEPGTTSILIGCGLFAVLTTVRRKLRK